MHHIAEGGGFDEKNARKFPFAQRSGGSVFRLRIAAAQGSQKVSAPAAVGKRVVPREDAQSRRSANSLAMKSKPGAEKLGWRVIESRCRFENKILRLREDRLEVPGKSEFATYAYMERAEAVVIVPVTSSGDVVLIQQYRYPVDEWCLETPAGGTHDAEGASLEETVRKELREEIGATAGEVRAVTWFYSANSLSDEKCHVFLAVDVELSHSPKTESTEALETLTVSVSEAVRMAKSGEMKTGPCALAMLLCEESLRALGFLK